MKIPRPQLLERSLPEIPSPTATPHPSRSALYTKPLPASSLLDHHPLLAHLPAVGASPCFLACLHTTPYPTLCSDGHADEEAAWIKGEEPATTLATSEEEHTAFRNHKRASYDRGCPDFNFIVDVYLFPSGLLVTNIA